MKEKLEKVFDGTVGVVKWVAQVSLLTIGITAQITANLCRETVKKLQK